jgi:hypothetical protein
MQRRYDKGDRRHKHDWHNNYAGFQAEKGRLIGKCPSSLYPQTPLVNQLLAAAIPEPEGDREIDYDKRLYVVHEGVIYEAQTSDHGTTYHAYPFRGRLAPELVASLRRMAERDGCLAEFRKWLSEHVWK